MEIFFNTVPMWILQTLKPTLTYLWHPNIGPPAPLQTEFSRFCKMKYLLEKETHNKNEGNHLKELNEIFLMVWFA